MRSHIYVGRYTPTLWSNLLPVSSALKMKPAGTYLPYYVLSCPRIQHSSWCYILFNFFVCHLCCRFLCFFYTYCLTNKVY